MSPSQSGCLVKRCSAKTRVIVTLKVEIAVCHGADICGDGSAGAADPEFHQPDASDLHARMAAEPSLRAVVGSLGGQPKTIPSDDSARSVWQVGRVHWRVAEKHPSLPHFHHDTQTTNLTIIWIQNTRFSS